VRLFSCFSWTPLYSFKNVRDSIESDFTFVQVPGLAVVIVGSRKDSQTYVNTKRKACAEVGIKSFDVGLPEEVSEADLISKVHELNSNPDVHG